MKSGIHFCIIRGDKNRFAEPINIIIQEGNSMSKKINGKIYYLIDVVCDNDFIYEVYEDDNGNRVKIVIGER